MAATIYYYIYFSFSDFLSIVNSALSLLLQVKEYLPGRLIINEEFEELLSILSEVVCTVGDICELKIRQDAGSHPSTEIEKQRLQFFLENGFKVEEMALLLSCSKRTVERRLRTYDLSTRNYTPISDSELDEILSQWSTSFPRCGVKMILGRLRSQGIYVQRERVRQSLKRVDPMGVERRICKVLHRRFYNVTCSNALWHVDGYHKLIRWRMVIHGAIDGYSRLITFLKVATNNMASTVLSAFLTATGEFGLPSRIRTDRGGENVSIARIILNVDLADEVSSLEKVLIISVLKD